jgi:hypothetical protein
MVKITKLPDGCLVLDFKPQLSGRLILRGPRGVLEQNYGAHRVFVSADFTDIEIEP